MIVYILVVCCKDNIGEYEMLANSIKNTWGKKDTESVKIRYLWCNNYKPKRKDKRDWILNKEEGYGMLLWKTLGWMLKNRHKEFDYVFRVNIGSYVNTERLIEFLKDKPRGKFYCGTPGNFEGIKYVSGSGFILSKDLVLLSLRNIKSFGFDHIDDISFGRFMMKFNIPIDQRGIRITNTGSGEIYQIGERIIPEEEFDLDKVYHWRLRNEDGARYQDVLAMEALYKRFHQ